MLLGKDLLHFPREHAPDVERALSGARCHITTIRAAEHSKTRKVSAAHPQFSIPWEKCCAGRARTRKGGRPSPESPPSLEALQQLLRTPERKETVTVTPSAELPGHSWTLPQGECTDAPLGCTRSGVGRGRRSIATHLNTTLVQSEPHLNPGALKPTRASLPRELIPLGI